MTTMVFELAIGCEGFIERLRIDVPQEAACIDLPNVVMQEIVRYDAREGLIDDGEQDWRDLYDIQFAQPGCIQAIGVGGPEVKITYNYIGRRA